MNSLQLINSLATAKNITHVELNGQVYPKINAIAIFSSETYVNDWAVVDNDSNYLLEVIDVTDKDKLELEKGESTEFLNYTIKNCANNDGVIVLTPSGSHLGLFFGIGTKENVDKAKKDALLHYMITKPVIFAQCLIYKLTKPNSGTYQEYYLLKSSVKKSGFQMPKEITCSSDGNCMIYFNDKPLN